MPLPKLPGAQHLEKCLPTPLISEPEDINLDTKYWPEFVDNLGIEIAIERSKTKLIEKAPRTCYRQAKKIQKYIIQELRQIIDNPERASDLALEIIEDPNTPVFIQMLTGPEGFDMIMLEVMIQQYVFERVSEIYQMSECDTYDLDDNSTLFAITASDSLILAPPSNNHHRDIIYIAPPLTIIIQHSCIRHSSPNKNLQRH